MSIQKVILAGREVGDPPVEINILNEPGRVTITFSSEGLDLPPKAVLENHGGASKLFLWDDRTQSISHRTVILVPQQSTEPVEQESSPELLIKKAPSN